jgi:flagellar hook-associated protein 3 FlgL
MLPIIDPSGQKFLQSLNRLQDQLNESQVRMASGRKLNAPSDAPDQVSPVLQLHADIRSNQAITNSLKNVKTDVDTAEQTLSSSIDLMQQASVLATQATGPYQTAETRASMADNVQSILEQMIANSNTTVGGRYIFSGDQDQNPSYQLDLTTPTGVATLQTPVATRQAAGPNGATFPVALSAGQIFDSRDPVTGVPTSTNVFAALNNLRVALAANDDAGIQAAAANLSDSSKYLNDQLAFYGHTQQRIASALDTTQNTGTRLQTELGSRQDADLATEITAMQQAQTQMQAALQMRAQMPRTTLFDVIGAPPTA